MFQSTFRRVPLAVAALTLCSGIGVWAMSAGPAGASATFSPQLEPTTQTEQTVTAEKAAPYTLTKSSVKRLTKIKKASAVSSSTSTSGSSSGSELSRAQALLAAQISQHPILKGTTVSFGDAHGYQAIAFYSSGRIVISASHTASLERIIAHEVWHVIDWRDNGRIDWGENVPR